MKYRCGTTARLLAAAALAISGVTACADSTGPVAGGGPSARPSRQQEGGEFVCRLAGSEILTNVTISGETGTHDFTVSGVYAFTGTGFVVANPLFTSDISGLVAGTGLTFTVTYTTELALGFSFDAAGTIDPATGGATGTATVTNQAGSPFPVGTTLTFSIPSGTFVCAQVASHCPNAPAAPAIAAAYLHSLDMKPNDDAYDNIIAQVARAMGPRATFMGVSKCSPAYADAVRSFVDDLLP